MFFQKSVNFIIKINLLKILKFFIFYYLIS